MFFDIHLGDFFMALAIVVFMSSIAMFAGHADLSEAVRTILGAAGGMVLAVAISGFRK